MAQQEATGFCRNCNRQVMIRRKGTNHVLHLLLTLCTAGLWLIGRLTLERTLPPLRSKASGG